MTVRTATGGFWRAQIIVTILGLGWLILAGRLLQLQWWQREPFAEKAQRQREFVEEVPARPGEIVDRQGRLLATTLTCRSLFVVPSLITDAAAIAEPLADTLGLDQQVLTKRIEANSKRQFLWIKRRLSGEEVELVKQLNLPRTVWGFREEYRREYPHGVVAAHVLGLRDIDGDGRGGIEEYFDASLRGRNGFRRIARDARGHVIEILDEEHVSPVHGKTIRLSLDVVIQVDVERELDAVMREWTPESCCAVVMDPGNGEIVAMATRPTFDPRSPHDASAECWKNRVISDIYEPGSTFKPMIVGYGLDRGLLKTTDEFHCENGQYRMGRRVLHDHHRYGKLSLTDVLVKSSNIGMAKIGERLQNDHLYEAARLFGFGQKTGVELPGELPGILRPRHQWTSYSTGSIPMGHEIAATPLQLITAHAALANGGLNIRPRIVLHETDNSVSAEPQLAEPIISRDTAKWLVEEPMHQVVVRGTGKKAQLRDYHVFGKTGTSQCLSPDGGYVHGKYISSFVCGAPVEAPRLLVLVVVNRSSVGGETFGGRVAAPAAGSILRHALAGTRFSPVASPIKAAATFEK